VSDTGLSRTRDGGTSWQVRGESQFADDNEIGYQPDAMRELGFLGGERLRELSRAADLIAVRIYHRTLSFKTCSSSCVTRMASVKVSRQ
jgi:hypothetical protein